MNLLIVNDAQRADIAKINAKYSGRQLSPVPLADGTWALNADVLTDADTWGEWLPALASADVAADVQTDSALFMKADAPAEFAAVAARYDVEKIRLQIAPVEPLLEP